MAHRRSVTSPSRQRPFPSTPAESGYIDSVRIGWIKLDTFAPGFIPSGPWFAWHIDRFTVPPGATELARTELCPHAFVHGRSVGLQFHPEVDEVIVKGWSAACPDEYFEEKDVDRAALYGGPQRHAVARDAFFGIVDWMVDELAVS